MDIVKLINTVGGILGAVGLIMTVIVGALYFGKRAEKDKDNNTISTYEKNDEAQSKLLATRDRQIAELQTLHDANLKRIELAETKAEILEKQVTQAPSINKLIIQQATQHKEMMGQMVTMATELGNIAKALPRTSIINVEGKSKE